MDQKEESKNKNVGAIDKIKSTGPYLLRTGDGKTKLAAKGKIRLKIGLPRGSHMAGERPSQVRPKIT